MSKDYVKVVMDLSVSVRDSITVSEKMIKDNLLKSLVKHLLDNIDDLPIEYNVSKAPNMNGYHKHTMSFTVISNDELGHLREMEHRYNKYCSQ